ncbi:hypothetical protein M9458_026679, partial [Cirrhinus mrigala]
IVEKDRFQTLGDLWKQWTESGVETSRATVYRRVQEMGYRCHIPQVKPLLNQKQRQKRLTWATEKQHWTVAQWSKREMPKCLKSSVKYPQSVMVWGAMSAAVNAASYQEILEHFMLPSAEKLYGDDFIFQHDLAPAHRDARPNTLDELKAAIEASWASITPQQCHRLIASMPRRIEAVISAKGFPTKY